jgi:hypothetical protein
MRMKERAMKVANATIEGRGGMGVVGKDKRENDDQFILF